MFTYLRIQYAILQFSQVQYACLVPNKPYGFCGRRAQKGSFLVQRNVENQPNYESLVHNMTFKSNKMSLP